jgi:hypothetical protein
VCVLVHVHTKPDAVAFVFIQNLSLSYIVMLMLIMFNGALKYALELQTSSRAWINQPSNNARSKTFGLDNMHI